MASMCPSLPTIPGSRRSELRHRSAIAGRAPRARPPFLLVWHADRGRVGKVASMIPTAQPSPAWVGRGEYAAAG